MWCILERTFDIITNQMVRYYPPLQSPPQKNPDQWLCVPFFKLLYVWVRWHFLQTCHKWRHFSAKHNGILSRSYQKRHLLIIQGVIIFYTPIYTRHDVNQKVKLPISTQTPLKVVSEGSMIGIPFSWVLGGPPDHYWPKKQPQNQKKGQIAIPVNNTVLCSLSWRIRLGLHVT